MIGTAWAADAAGEHGGIFSDPAFWVGVAFVLFFALAGKILWTARLRHARQALGDDRQGAGRCRAAARRGPRRPSRRPSARLRGAATEGGAILQQAREEAQRMQARAAASLKNAVALREQQALDRIAQSEAAAAKQVRDTAVDVALSATRGAVARAGRRGPQRGHGQRGDRRLAEAPALEFFDCELPA